MYTRRYGLTNNLQHHCRCGPPNMEKPSRLQSKHNQLLCRRWTDRTSRTNKPPTRPRRNRKTFHFGRTQNERPKNEVHDCGRNTGSKGIIHAAVQKTGEEEENTGHRHIRERTVRVMWEDTPETINPATHENRPQPIGRKIHRETQTG